MTRTAVLGTLVLALLAQGSVGAQGERPQTGASASGVVVDGVTGRPVEGAEVRVSIADMSLGTAMTGPDGRFTLVNIESGDDFVSASKDGYHELWLDSAPTHFAFTAATHVTGLRLTLFKMPTLSGRVVDLTGQPVRDAEVAMVYQNWEKGRQVSSRGERVQTDDNGEFRLADLWPMKFAVVVGGLVSHSLDPSASPRRVAIVPTYFPGLLDLGDAFLPTLTWAEDRRLQDWVVEFVPTATVSGRVRGMRGGEKLGVRFLSDDFPRVGLVGSEVAADGAFSMTMPPGPYELRVSSEEVAAPHPSGVFGQAPVNLAAGDARRLDVDVHYPGDVSGVVIVSGSGNLPTVSLALSPYSDRFGATGRAATMDSTGRFRFQAVPPGKYFVRAAAQPPWHFVDAQLNGRTVTDQPLTVSPGGMSGLEVVFDQSVSSLSGKTSDLPGADLTVAVFPTDRQLWTDFPQPDSWEGEGRRLQQQFLGHSRSYTFSDLPSGIYYVVAYANMFGGEIVDIDDWASPPNLERLAGFATIVTVYGPTAAPLLKAVDFKAPRSRQASQARASSRAPGQRWPADSNGRPAGETCYSTNGSMAPSTASLTFTRF